MPFPSASYRNTMVTRGLVAGEVRNVSGWWDEPDPRVGYAGGWCDVEVSGIDELTWGELAEAEAALDAAVAAKEEP